MKLRPLSEGRLGEKLFMTRVALRCGCVQSDLDRILPKTHIGIVVKRPYIFVEVSWPKLAAGAVFSTYGFSKQCTYKPVADSWDEEAGTRIALARAVRQWGEPVKCARAMKEDD